MESIEHTDVETLANLVIKHCENNKNTRFLLGIVGTPGAGKSTLAGRLMKQINKLLFQDIAIVVPMDGFHYHNDILVEKGLLALKGKPETFDAENFVKLVNEIASAKGEKIYCPSYSRVIHNPVPNSIVVENNHKIIIIEGNYLLLATSPWNELANVFDETWFIEASDVICRERLIRRHMKPGKSSEEALQKIESTDAPNAELILQTRHRASKRIKITSL